MRDKAVTDWLASNDLTTTKLAEELGVHYMTVERWLLRKAKPRGLYVRALRYYYPDCPFLPKKKENQGERKWTRERK